LISLEFSLKNLYQNIKNLAAEEFRVTVGVL
jgi:hypothetical protein